MASGAAHWVIPPGRERLLDRMLRVRTDGWRLERIAVDRTTVVAWYANESASARARVRLAHPEQASDPPHLRTERFVLRAGVSPRGTDTSVLLREVARGVRRLEARFEWVAAGDEGSPRGRDPEGELVRDTELLALRAGLKPAARLALREGEVSEAARRLEAHGLHVEVLRDWVPHAGRSFDVLLAAYDREGVRALAAQERALMEARHFGDRAAEARAAEVLGRQLGYPACCVAAHRGRIEEGVDDALQVWAAVRDAWVAEPEPRLNSLVPGLRLRLISFEPCRFDCAAALERADAVAAELERRHPGHLAPLERELGRSVVVHRAGERAWARVERPALAERVEATLAQVTPLPDSTTRSVSEAGRRLAGRWTGASVDARGRVDDGSDPPTLLVDFARVAEHRGARGRRAGGTSVTR